MYIANMVTMSAIVETNRPVIRRSSIPGLDIVSDINSIPLIRYIGKEP